MKTWFVALLSVGAVSLAPTRLLAQGEEDAVVVDEDAETAPSPDEGGEEEGLGDICAIDPEACPKTTLEEDAKRDLNEQVYAVQQIFALRARRFEVMPYWAFTMNDPFVSHPGGGLTVNYYITNVLGVGVNGNYYGPFNSVSDFNAEQRRATRVGALLTEYDWSATANFTYVPAYGKFAGLSDFIFQYDVYVVGGVGAISTRPIPVVDPGTRNFKWEPALLFNAGVGLRIFFSRWFAADLELRDYIFLEKLENTDPDAGDQYGDSKLNNNVQAQVGLSVFLPFSVEYRLAK